MFQQYDPGRTSSPLFFSKVNEEKKFDKKKERRKQYMLLIDTYVGNLNTETIGRMKRSFSELYF